MKHLSLLIAAVCALLLAGCSDRPVAPAELPQPIQAFVKQYFPNQNISFAKKDWEWTGYQYDVILADGSEISFDTDNQWDKVDTKLNAVPAALVPAPISNYVAATFPAGVITKIDKEYFGYEVELANSIELHFNEAGMVTDMDD